MTEATRRWAVVYAGPAGREPWAVVEDVPRAVKADEVREALESWQHWPNWQTRVGVGGRVTINPEGGKVWRALINDETEARIGADYAGATVIPWHVLAPTVRKLTISLESALWARLRVAAARDGMTLTAWTAARLTDALRPARVPVLTGTERCPRDLHTLATVDDVLVFADGVVCRACWDVGVELVEVRYNMERAGAR